MRLLCLALSLLIALPALAASPIPPAPRPLWKTDRPHKAVVVGGSISMYYAGNFGEYLQHGCRDLEVINRGKVGAGGPALARIVRDDILGDPALTGPMRGGKGWILFQGGLNSVGSPESTAWFLSRLFLTAHEAGLQVVALTLTPWGSDADKRFDGWEGLRIQRATDHVSQFILGRLTPALAFGGRTQDRTVADGPWLPGELPAIGVNVLQSPLQAGKEAPLRPREPLLAGFAKGPFRKQVDKKDLLVAAAQAVPQRFMARKYHDFDHVHPNGEGHRLMAALVCQQAPAAWACDCDAIRRAAWKGKVVAAKATP